MKAKQANVEALQAILSGLMSGSQMHYMHAVINRKKGFTKLADRMMEEYNEEVASIADFANRLLDMGVTPKVEAASYPVYDKVEEQLRNECKTQWEGVEMLNKMYQYLEFDVVTDNLFTEYIEDETEHAVWLQQQVDLIDAIGIQNYLAKQM